MFLPYILRLLTCSAYMLTLNLFHLYQQDEHILCGALDFRALLASISFFLIPFNTKFQSAMNPPYRFFVCMYHVCFPFQKTTFIFLLYARKETHQYSESLKTFYFSRSARRWRTASRFLGNLALSHALLQ